MIEQHIDRRPEEAPGDLSAGGWDEFTAARARFFAHIAAESAAWIAARRLPGPIDGRYDCAPADQGEHARSQ